MSGKLIARWESRSGKHYVNLTTLCDESGKMLGYGYDAPGATGTLADATEDAAVAEVQRRVDRGWFQPDANKTPMQRVA